MKFAKSTLSLRSAGAGIQGVRLPACVGFAEVLVRRSRTEELAGTQECGAAKKRRRVPPFLSRPFCGESSHGH